MFERILVPVDGSRLAENVMPHAIVMAKAYNSEITLISVLDPLASSGSSQPVDPLDWQFRQAELDSYLQDLSSRFQSSNLNIRTIRMEGKAPDNVLHHSNTMDANLIMLSSHGQGGLSGWNLSSVVTKIIQQASTSVMMIRSFSSPQHSQSSPLYRRILVPVDGSRRAEYALIAASRLASEQGTELLVAHVIKPPELPRKTPLSAQENLLVSQLVESNRVESTHYLEDLKATLDFKIRTHILMGESVAEALYALIEQEEIDLVIQNAHGLGANLRRPYGSVTINFLAFCETALLIVQDYDRDTLLETKLEANLKGFQDLPPEIDKARPSGWEAYSK